MHKLTSFSLLSSLLLAALPAAAQPVVNAIENNYSFIPPGVPNYGIAQGSIFVIFGTGLAATSTPVQNAPLKTTLNGVSVQFSIQGANTQALLYYVTPTQIAGILPSATPTGSGTVTVTSGTQTSAAAPLTVVQSAIGILTQFGTIANATDAGKQLSTFAYAANPGDTVTFYGTGAGPVPGDESIQQTPQNLANIPLEIDIGGVPATVTYHGRSIYPGLDQFNVVVPAGVLGCNVAVVPRSGNITGSTVTIPIAASGRTCTDNLSGVSVLHSTTTLTQNSQPSGTVDVLVTGTLQASASPAQPNSSVTTQGGGLFDPFSGTPGETVNTSGAGPSPSMGGCLLIPEAFPATPPPATSTSSTPVPLLNAGPQLNFTGPNGVVSIQRASGGSYSGPLSLITGQVFIPPSGGMVTVDNGSGGADIGPFQQSITVPAPLTLTNASAIGFSIDRTKPLTFQWTGGGPTDFVTIEGGSGFTSTASGPLPGFKIGMEFSCTAPATAGQFTVPSWVLSALPAQPNVTTESESTLPTYVLIRTQHLVPSQTAGLSLVIYDASSEFAIYVSYQ